MLDITPRQLAATAPTAQEGHEAGLARQYGLAAEQLLRHFAPRRVFDAGCGSGLLVQALRARGVAAFGRDSSVAAIGQARSDIRRWCKVGFVTDPLDGAFDLVVCTGTLAPLTQAAAAEAIRNFTAAAPRVLFAAGADTQPDQLRTQADWLALWEAAGLVPVIAHDAGYAGADAYVLERGGAGCADTAAFAALLTHRASLAQASASVRAAALRADVARELAALSSELAAAQRAAADAAAEARDAQAVNAAQRHELESLRQALRAAPAQAESPPAPPPPPQAAPLPAPMAPSAPRPLPAQLRRHLRFGAQLLVWTARRQLGPKLRERRAILARVQAVAASPLFDAGWYLARNPDVAASGMDPVLHFVTSGSGEGRDPGPAFVTGHYLDRHPEARGLPGGALVHALTHGTTADGMTAAYRAQPQIAAAPLPPLPAGETAASVLLERQYPYLAALPVFASPALTQKRLTVVLDSMGANHLYGGVGTAIILAALTAQRTGAALRFVTRSEPADPSRVGAILRLHGVEWRDNIEFMHTPRDGSPGARGVAVAPNDFFITTSWWSTWSVRQAVPRARVAYLLQEDERMFYPLGDDHLRCSETLTDPGLLYLVNSQLLLGHLQAEGMAPGAIAFEPAFPAALYRPAARNAGERRGFFFYARPHNDRNLYWRGVEALSAAIEDGVLDPAEWEFHFAGHGAGGLSLPRGARVRFPGSMPWAEYARFIGGMDLGLSLMYTPHPSYPPLDLAASGAVVLTNRFGPKRDLDGYCANIICANPDAGALVEGLRRAAALANDTETRTANFNRAGLQRDWRASLAPALDKLSGWAGG